ncbi:hypothetical protein V5O48_005705 [Marasmius crinis-equi]|uniref:Methyltransferase domain-containing protein n=1 Tax=Marasmius crinis-equi TaxID=585013 RepID=A0ABR3FM12_9AGAR
MALQLDQLETLTSDELTFLKEQIGIEDETQLKEHVVKVASKANDIFGYYCIQTFHFLRLKAWHNGDDKEEDILRSAYQHALDLCSKREGAIYLDFGCCFGVDLRRAVKDGIPVQNAIGTDLRSEFWDLGHELFRSTPETFPAAFIGGNAFDTSFLSGSSPTSKFPDTPTPDLRGLTSLTPLQGRVSAIYVGSVFHLFDARKQVELARKLSSLLAPVVGSVIFGSQRGSERSHETQNLRRGGLVENIYIYNPADWRDIWSNSVFPVGSVEVEPRSKFMTMVFSDGDALLREPCNEDLRDPSFSVHTGNITTTDRQFKLRLKAPDRLFERPPMLKWKVVTACIEHSACLKANRPPTKYVFKSG